MVYPRAKFGIYIIILRASIIELSLNQEMQDMITFYEYF